MSPSSGQTETGRSCDLRPLGDPNADLEQETVGSYLCIISCPPRRITKLMKSLKAAKKDVNDRPSFDPGLPDQIATDTENNPQPDSNFEDFDLEPPQDWIPVIESLAGQRALTWEEYAKLRGLPNPAGC
ncbi:hypothetical protein FBUS_06131 [Fasciolopsis buskii]|uniref:Uncharacterized protein n=1 Tax=Fasciolopsis buskii TaxID=27845 RepID=A0A8E0RXV4_9TREM|nr:hypothetical protein FBUS_06131 [Fasciolopsis buski]